MYAYSRDETRSKRDREKKSEGEVNRKKKKECLLCIKISKADLCARRQMTFFDETPTFILQTKFTRCT